MKKTTFMVAFCCLAFMSNAQNNETPAPHPVEISASDEVSRELVASTNGIDIYYSSSDISGNILLNIHFVNTSEKAVTFSWEVAKDERTFNSQKAITLEPGKSIDQNAALEVKGTTDLSDYSISLTTK